MAVNLSPLAGAGWQFFDNSGNVLTGGKLYTYASGTTTPAVVYTSVSGLTAHTNPIILDAAGRIPGGEVWLDNGYGYKFILKDANDVQIGSYDNIPTQAPPPVVIVNDASSIAYEKGYTLTAGSFVVGDTYLIVSTGTTNFVAIGAATNTVGLHFTATGIGSGTGTAKLSRTVESKLQEAISVKDFGAVGDGTTNDTVAFAAAAAAINAAGGGKLIIPQGTYIIGSQTFAGATGKGYAYQAATLLQFTNCTKPVIVEGEGAILKFAAGMRFGSFDPVTGLPYTTTPPFYNADYTANLGVMIGFDACTNAVIRDIELDGNINNMIIGGGWGDTGIQLGALGLVFSSCKQASAENVYTHHHGLDGVEIVWTGLTNSETNLYPHTLKNVRSTYNSRQGLSWVGGNALTCIDCDFSNTGRNGAVVSSPASGIDIEPETSICRNGTFINCRFYNNVGAGVLGSTGLSPYMSFYNCQMIGTTYWSIWGQAQWRYHDCLIVGAMVYPGGDATDPVLASKYFGCRFYMDTAYSPNGTIYGPRMNLDFSNNCLFEGCEFTAETGYQLPYSLGNLNGTNYDNCIFYQQGSGTFYTRGNFRGRSRITYPLGTFDATGTVVFGNLELNGVESGMSLPTIDTLSLSSNDAGSGKTVRMVSYYSNTVWAYLVGGAIRGDVVYYPNPSSGGYIGQVCTVSSVSTTGSINSGTTLLIVASGTNIANGESITVVGAGAAGTNLVTTVSSGGGTTSLTLAASASTSVAGVVVTTAGVWNNFGLIA
jgi:hypothetical protein